MRVLMASNWEIILEKWGKSEGNPILKAGDIAYTKATISQYYAGTSTINDKRAVVEYITILSNQPYLVTKRGKI